MKCFLMLLAFILSVPAFAHERGETEKNREDSFGTIMAGYQFASTWVVGKYTGSYTQILSHDWSIEFEYATNHRDVVLAGFDLGDLKEERYTLLGKYYIGNSFFVGFGPFMYKLRMETEGKVRDQLNLPVSDTWAIEGYGVAVAFGSRWQAKNGLTWGVDWIRMSQPLKDGKIVRRVSDLSNDDELEAKRSFSILRTVPTFTFVGVSVGYTF